MGTENSAEQHLKNACRVSQVVSRTIEQHGHTDLLSYVKRLMVDEAPPLQPRRDLLEIVDRHVRSILGDDAARSVVQDLEHAPFMLTASHHGADFFAQSVQGSLISSLPRFMETPALRTVPVFAFGNVPLNNLTYPRGLLLYNVNGFDPGDMPVRLPIFSDRLKRGMVNAAPAMDQSMVKRAITRVDTLVRKEKICTSLKDPICRLFSDAYAAQEVLAMPSYSHRATMINHKIWNRMFETGTDHPQLVYLEIEKLVADLLAHDL